MDSSWSWITGYKTFRPRNPIVNCDILQCSYGDTCGGTISSPANTHLSFPVTTTPWEL